MSDLLHVLPDLNLKQFSHILPSLEKASITSNDLLTLDVLDVAKRAQIPLAEVRRLSEALIEGLQADISAQWGQRAVNEDALQEETKEHAPEGAYKSSNISTLCPGLDEALHGGFATGQLSEITGESAAGKTQVLLSLLLAVQLPRPHGLAKSALYISTEAPLQTNRLSQILQSNAIIQQYAHDEQPSLSHIQSTKVRDLEAQDHILQYQVPVAIARNNIGLIIIDSIAANFRAEFDSGGSNNGNRKKSAEAFAERSRHLIRLGSHLRKLARDHNIAIVVANQVLDRFTAAAAAFDYVSQPASQTISVHTNNNEDARPRSAQGFHNTNASNTSVSQDSGPRDQIQSLTPIVLSTIDPLAVDHQQRFFTGWGDAQFPFYTTSRAASNLKTPSLGLTWTNQLSARVVLLKDPIYKMQDYVLGNELEISGWKRRMKVAFAKWCEDSNGGSGTAFEIWEAGLRHLEVEEAEDKSGPS